MIFTQKGWSYSGNIFSDSDYLGRVTTMDIGFDINVTQSTTQVYTQSNSATRENTVSEQAQINSYTSTSNDLFSVNLVGSISVIYGTIYLRVKVNGTTVDSFQISSGQVLISLLMFMLKRAMLFLFGILLNFLRVQIHNIDLKKTLLPILIKTKNIFL